MATRTSIQTLRACRNCGSTEGCADVMSVAQAAERIGVSRQAVAQLRERGEIEALLEPDGKGNPGGRPRWLIPIESVDAYVTRRNGRAKASA